MKNLCIDWGNSRVKAAIFQDDQIIEDFNFSIEEAISEIVKILDTHQPDSSILCSVTHFSADLNPILTEKTKFLELNSSVSLPIMNAYGDTSKLGYDRIALSVAINDQFPNKNNLVVSLGTALTYNFSQKPGIFRGGNITPGLEMRLKSLHEFTDRLPLIDKKGETLLIGYDTETSIRGGVIFGMAAEIDGMINYYRSQYSDFNAVLAGGDISIFADKLKNQIFADSQLLLKGLNSILKHNVR